jgi:hypothetical protein
MSIGKVNTFEAAISLGQHFQNCALRVANLTGAASAAGQLRFRTVLLDPLRDIEKQVLEFKGALEDQGVTARKVDDPPKELAKWPGDIMFVAFALNNCAQLSFLFAGILFSVNGMRKAGIEAELAEDDLREQLGLVLGWTDAALKVLRLFLDAEDAFWEQIKSQIKELQ